jgi:hypothetical protein
LMDENSGDFQASVRLLILYGMWKKPTYTCATEDAMQQISKHYCLAWFSVSSILFIFLRTVSRSPVLILSFCLILDLPSNHTLTAKFFMYFFCLPSELHIQAIVISSLIMPNRL